jgi:hypothetical protein
MSLKNEVRTVADATSNIFEIPMPSIAFDLDGTIDEAPIFFTVLSHCWPGSVFVITFRKDREKAVAELEKFDIHYDELVLVNSLEEKAKAVMGLGILAYFDDQDECLQGIGSIRNVFKVRNGGNYDFEAQKWLYSDKTGRKI